MFDLMLLKKRIGVTNAYALFAGGWSPGNVHTALERYVFSTGVVTTSQLAGGASGSSFIGNVQFGLLMGGGAPYNQRLLYVYASDVRSVASVSAINRYSMRAVGNSLFGIFSGGIDPGTNSTVAVSEKIIYSNLTKVNGTSLIQRRQVSSAFGNSLFGIFAGGTSVTNGTDMLSSAEKYSYSNDAVAAATSLTIARYSPASGGNGEFGYSAGGYSGAYVLVCDKYTYSNNTVHTATNLLAGREDAGSACNLEYTLIAGGKTSGGGWISSTDRYRHANDTVSSGSALSTPRMAIAGVSTNPGGWSV